MAGACRAAKKIWFSSSRAGPRRSLQPKRCCKFETALHPPLNTTTHDRFLQCTNELRPNDGDRATFIAHACLQKEMFSMKRTAKSKWSRSRDDVMKHVLSL
jgi:hypothetical protein